MERHAYESTHILTSMLALAAAAMVGAKQGGGGGCRRNTVKRRNNDDVATLLLAIVASLIFNGSKIFLFDITEKYRRIVEATCSTAEKDLPKRNPVQSSKALSKRHYD